MEDAYFFKKLEMIEKVILRMASNSFRYKGWSITAVSTLLALAAKESFPGYAVVAIVPAMCFWGLDAYYLRLERGFVKLFETVAEKGPQAAGTATAFSMRPQLDSVASWWTILVSPSVAGLHVSLLAMVVAGALMTWGARPVDLQQPARIQPSASAVAPATNGHTGK